MGNPFTLTLEADEGAEKDKHCAAALASHSTPHSLAVPCCYQPLQNRVLHFWLELPWWLFISQLSLRLDLCGEGFSHSHSLEESLPMPWPCPGPAVVTPIVYTQIHIEFRSW